MTSETLPRVQLEEDELDRHPEDGEVYASLEDMAPMHVPYVLMGYNPRIQLFLLFERSRKTLTLGEIVDAVDAGSIEEVYDELRWMYSMGVIKAVGVGEFRFNRDNPIAIEIGDLFYELRQQQMDSIEDAI